MTADGDGAASRALVSGRSSIWWARVGLIALTAVIVTVGVLFVVLIAWPPGDDGSAPVDAVLVTLVVTGAAAIVCLVAGAVQDIREMRAGYTTAFAWHRSLDQIDPATGEVVRHAGKPLITAKVLDARRGSVDGPGP